MTVVATTGIDGVDGANATYGGAPGVRAGSGGDGKSGSAASNISQNIVVTDENTQYLAQGGRGGRGGSGVNNSYNGPGGNGGAGGAGASALQALTGVTVQRGAWSLTTIGVQANGGTGGRGGDAGSGPTGSATGGSAAAGAEATALLSGVRAPLSTSLFANATGGTGGAGGYSSPGVSANGANGARAVAQVTDSTLTGNNGGGLIFYIQTNAVGGNGGLGGGGNAQAGANGAGADALSVVSGNSITAGAGNSDYTRLIVGGTRGLGASGNGRAAGANGNLTLRLLDNTVSLGGGDGDRLEIQLNGDATTVQVTGNTFDGGDGVSDTFDLRSDRPRAADLSGNNISGFENFAFINITSVNFGGSLRNGVVSATGAAGVAATTTSPAREQVLQSTGAALAGNLQLSLSATGGAGAQGLPFAYPSGAAGGGGAFANSSVFGSTLSADAGSQSVLVAAIATGGAGGAGRSNTGYGGGSGGYASASSSSASLSTGADDDIVVLRALATGGAGGAGATAAGSSSDGGGAGGDAAASVTYNTIDLGAGADRLTLSARGAGGATASRDGTALDGIGTAYITDNTIQSGDGADVVRLEASTSGVVSQPYDPYSSTGTVRKTIFITNNVVDLGSGDDTLAISTAASGGYVQFGSRSTAQGSGQNTFNGGVGIDTLDLSGLTNEVDVTSAIVVLDMTLSENQLGTNWGSVNNVTGFEIIIGTIYKDQVKGTSANETFTGSAGNDSFDGGAGVDTAIYFGASSSYLRTRNTDGSLTVTDLRSGSPDGTDTLRNVELLQFADGVVSLLPATTVHDFGSDGRADLVWRGSDGSIRLWSMNGSAITNDSLVTTIPNNWKIVGVGDVTGDGRADLVWESSAGEVRTWTMNGAAITFDRQVATGIPAEYGVQRVADFTDDGKADLLWRSSASGAIRLWTMNADGQLAADQAVATVSTDWKIAGAGDFDGDGKADMLWRNDNGANRLWLMNGASIALDTALGNGGASVPTSWKVENVGDVNGDGRADIVWHNGSTGEVRLWLMNGAAIAADVGLAPSGVGSAWAVQDAADFTGDGRADLMWRNADTGEVRLWTMTSSGAISADQRVALVGAEYHVVNSMAG